MPVPKDELDKMSARVCAHMNADHADSCVAWARYYARLADAASAEMTAVTPEGWALTVTMRDGSAKSVVVPYDPPLAAAKDVRKCAVAMHFAAFNGLGLRYKLANGYYSGAARQALHHMPKWMLGAALVAVVGVAAGVARALR